MARGSAKGRQIVPGAHKALDAMKYEIAGEMGLPVGRNRTSAGMTTADTEFAAEVGSPVNGAGAGEDYWGYIASRDAGAVGGHMTRNLIRKAQENLFQSQK